MDIAAISAAVAQPLAASPPAALTQADALATQRFQDLMAPAANAAPPAGAAPAAPAAPMADEAVPGSAPRSLGETILSGMNNLSTEFQQSWKTVNAVLSEGERMTMADMLKLQMGMVQMSVQYDLVGKAISRSTQNLDQLVKMQ